jgi:ribosomal protein L20A (L18A)
MTEKTCNQFIKEMKEAGFSFTYRATNGTQTFTGEVKANGESEVKAVKSSEQSRQEIKQLFKRG